MASSIDWSSAAASADLLENFTAQDDLITTTPTDQALQYNLFVPNLADTLAELQQAAIRATAKCRSQETHNNSVHECMVACATALILRLYDNWRFANIATPQEIRDINDALKAWDGLQIPSACMKVVDSLKPVICDDNQLIVPLLPIRLLNAPDFADLTGVGIASQNLRLLLLQSIPTFNMYMSTLNPHPDLGQNWGRVRSKVSQRGSYFLLNDHYMPTPLPDQAQATFFDHHDHQPAAPIYSVNAARQLTYTNFTLRDLFAKNLSASFISPTYRAADFTTNYTSLRYSKPLSQFNNVPFTCVEDFTTDLPYLSTSNVNYDANRNRLIAVMRHAASTSTAPFEQIDLLNTKPGFFTDHSMNPYLVFEFTKDISPTPDLVFPLGAHAAIAHVAAAPGPPAVAGVMPQSAQLVAYIAACQANVNGLIENGTLCPFRSSDSNYIYPNWLLEPTENDKKIACGVNFHKSVHRFYACLPPTAHQANDLFRYTNSNADPFTSRTFNCTEPHLLSGPLLHQLCTQIIAMADGHQVGADLPDAHTTQWRSFYTTCLPNNVYFNRCFDSVSYADTIKQLVLTEHKIRDQFAPSTSKPKSFPKSDKLATATFAKDLPAVPTADPKAANAPAEADPK
jgi:hypothetical protein